MQDLLLIGGAVLAVGMADKPGAPRAFGLRPTPLWPAVGWAFAVLAAFYRLVRPRRRRFGERPSRRSPRTSRRDGGGRAVGYVALACLMAPIAEELFFRGLLFPALSARVGVAGGVIVTGAVFGAHPRSGGP